MPEQDQKPLAIIGCGFAGSAVLIHTLLKIADDPSITSPVKIVMLERKPEQLHAGLAYGKAPEYRNHNLNIGSKRVNPFPAGQMPPGFPTFPQYIQKLAQENPAMEAALTNPPRQLFGDYIHHLVGLAIEKAGGKAQVETLFKSAVKLEEHENGAHIACSDGSHIEAGNVVLATGFQDALAPKFAKACERSTRFLETPYSLRANGFFGKVCAEDPDKNVMIVGTGLTAMDTAVRLIKAGFKGKITMMSRRALMHKPYEPTPAQEYLDGKLRGEPRPESELEFTRHPPHFLNAATVKELVTGVVREFGALTAQGYTSEEIIGYWERFVPEVAKKFPHADLAGLLQANEVLITANRVGVTPDIGVAIHEALQSGQLEVLASAVTRLEEMDGKVCCHYAPTDGSVTFKARNEFNARAPDPQTRDFDYVISAMGNTVAYDPVSSDIRDPLWNGLMTSGKAAPHWTKMGVAVADNFAMLDREGNPSQHISVIGVPVAGHMMVTAYKYPEKPGAGGRLGPTALNVAGITGAIVAFLGTEYGRLTGAFRTEGARTGIKPKIPADTISA